jgi:hypothetical protein
MPCSFFHLWDVHLLEFVSDFGFRISDFLLRGPFVLCESQESSPRRSSSARARRHRGGTTQSAWPIQPLARGGDSPSAPRFPSKSGHSGFQSDTAWLGPDFRLEAVRLVDCWIPWCLCESLRVAYSHSPLAAGQCPVDECASGSFHCFASPVNSRAASCETARVVHPRIEQSVICRRPRLLSRWLRGTGSP